MNKIMLFVAFYLATIATAVVVNEYIDNVKDTDTVVVVDPPKIVEPYVITDQIPDQYLTYTEVVDKLKNWHKIAPEITEFGTYGKNRQDTDLHFLRVGTVGKPKVLIHSSIHGNEKFAAACTLGIMGTLLSDYQRNEEVTWLVENRDIYFVPVFSPESYLKDRWIEGGDPNRNWERPGNSYNNNASPIQAMQKWFQQMKFVAAIDGHSYGRDFFWPSLVQGEDKDKISKLAHDMANIAGYSASQVGGSPSGYAIDWYYWKGAAHGGGVSILTEFGRGTHNQPLSAIKPEVDKTYKAYLHFLKYAPTINLSGVESNVTKPPSLSKPKPQSNQSNSVRRRRWFPRWSL